MGYADYMVSTTLFKDKPSIPIGYWIKHEACAPRWVQCEVCVCVSAACVCRGWEAGPVLLKTPYRYSRTDGLWWSLIWHITVTALLGVVGKLPLSFIQMPLFVLCAWFMCVFFGSTELVRKIYPKWIEVSTHFSRKECKCGQVQRWPRFIKHYF